MAYGRVETTSLVRVATVHHGPGRVTVADQKHFLLAGNTVEAIGVLG